MPARAVDWEAEFSIPLRAGVKTFRRFVESWYRGRLPEDHLPAAAARSARHDQPILAGYAWDTKNPPYVADESGRRMRVLEELCSA